MFTARKLLESATIAISGGTTATLVTQPSGNPLSGMLDLLVLPGLTSGYWYTLATQQYLKALVFQWRIKPEFTAVTNPSDDSVFMTDTFKYGTRSRCAAGYGDWRYIFGGHA
jgi:phage major head subunit gpT-like protein